MLDNFMGSNMDLFTILHNFIVMNPHETVTLILFIIVVICWKAKEFI